MAKHHAALAGIAHHQSLLVGPLRCPLPCHFPPKRLLYHCLLLAVLLSAWKGYVFDVVRLFCSQGHGTIDGSWLQ